MTLLVGFDWMWFPPPRCQPPYQFICGNLITNMTSGGNSAVTWGSSQVELVPPPSLKQNQRQFSHLFRKVQPMSDISRTSPDSRSARIILDFTAPKMVENELLLFISQSVLKGFVFDCGCLLHRLGSLCGAWWFKNANYSMQCLEHTKRSGDTLMGPRIVTRAGGHCLRPCLSFSSRFCYSQGWNAAQWRTLGLWETSQGETAAAAWAWIWR